MILVKQFVTGDQSKVCWRKFYVKDPKKIYFWKKLRDMNNINFPIKIYEEKDV